MTRTQKIPNLPLTGTGACCAWLTPQTLATGEGQGLDESILVSIMFWPWDYQLLALESVKVRQRRQDF
ncbi:hypothetical protein F4811DRAFT_550213 [Daldinia bambusicola]|nr:hypothetical protein F4811DRAFT_550213 [Daldinia bambusicola]